VAKGLPCPSAIVAYAPGVPDLRERWQTGWFEATAYDWAVEHERVARVLGQLIWGTNTARFYGDIGRLADLPAGTSVLDIPCGGGVAFRGLRPAQSLRYLAADLSPVMLRRARGEAERRGLRWIEFAEADVESLPFEASAFDFCVSYTGLHCFPDPPGAIREMARVLRPGGELRGTTVVRQAGIRQDGFVRLMQIGGVFGPGLTHAELELSLADAGLLAARTERDGGLVYFSAHKPA
jgi:SAM-dependent methyltransferase